MTDEPRKFSPPALLIVSLAAGWGTIVFLKLHRHGISLVDWIDWVLSFAAVLGLYIIVDLLASRVAITADAIEVKTLLARRSYAFTEIEQVREARGAAHLKMSDGRWIHLPDLLRGRSITALVRHRLKQSDRQPKS